MRHTDGLKTVSRASSYGGTMDVMIADSIVNTLASSNATQKEKHIQVKTTIDKDIDTASRVK
eukprot:708846-Amphidinium_carterae.1